MTNIEMALIGLLIIIYVIGNIVETYIINKIAKKKYIERLKKAYAEQGREYRESEED